MPISEIQISTGCYEGEKTLPARFIALLEAAVAGGGTILSITRDEARFKKAYVLTPAEAPTLTVLYVCNANHQWSSARVIGVYSGRGSALHAAEAHAAEAHSGEAYEGDSSFSDEQRSLFMDIGQTQGLERGDEYMTEPYRINE